MNSHADKTQENRNQSVLNCMSQMQAGGESIFQFVDNRPEAMAQQKLKEMANNHTSQQLQTIQKKEDNTDLTDNLKAGVDSLSGRSLEDVKVHYNSPEPAQLTAYAQGTGQEQHLPHEAWHVVQQVQGRVKPTVQMKGRVNRNDDKPLKKEADVVGEALKLSPIGSTHTAIQFKKTTKPSTEPEYLEIIKSIGDEVKRNVLNGKNTNKEKSDAIWDEAMRVYTANEVKGRGYAQRVDAAVTKFKDTTVPLLGGGQSPKDELVANNTVKRSGYDTKFSNNYANAPLETLAANKYRVNTKGFDPNATAKPVVDQGEYRGDYSNEINLVDGSIKAAWNMAATVDRNDWSITSINDEALEAGKGLNNSEILWQQYKLAAEEKHSAALNKDADVLNELKNISTIKRDTIINTETLVTGYMAYDDGKAWDNDQDWVSGTSEFNAVVGTPNAKSSAFFLIDHMDQLEKEFDKITGTSSQGLDIKFKKI